MVREGRALVAARVLVASSAADKERRGQAAARVHRVPQTWPKHRIRRRCRLAPQAAVVVVALVAVRADLVGVVAVVEWADPVVRAAVSAVVVDVAVALRVPSDAQAALLGAAASRSGRSDTSTRRCTHPTSWAACAFQTVAVRQCDCVRARLCLT